MRYMLEEAFEELEEYGEHERPYNIYAGETIIHTLPKTSM